MRIQRSSHFIMRFDPRPQLDLGAMLRGQLAVVRDEPLVASSAATGETAALSEDDVRLLSALSSAEWSSADEVLEALGLERSVLDGLLERALILADDDEPVHAAARRREEELTALAWDDNALLYHVASRCEGSDAGAPLKAAAAAEAPGSEVEPEDAATAAADIGFAGSPAAGSPAAGSPAPGTPGPGTSGAGMPAASAIFAPGAVAPGVAQPSPQSGAAAGGDVGQHVALASMLGQQLQASVAHFGPPPSHFHRPASVRSTHDLPAPTHQGWLLDLLRQRRTVRLYEPSESMSLEELSTLLYYVYGCHGVAPLAPGVVGLRKTSPSGGAMHPVEVYPLILQVENVPCGLYHYSVERHALSLLRPLEPAEGRQLAETFTSGQTYYATAHALFLLTARFFRNYWKYRKSQKAYKVVHLDAGHLSQTLYLLSTALGLGAFFTGAVNDVDIERALGIDGVSEGVIGISGCGRPRRQGDVLGFETQPYSPRSTQV